MTLTIAKEQGVLHVLNGEILKLKNSTMFKYFLAARLIDEHRLENATPVSYAEVRERNKDKKQMVLDIDSLMGEGEKLEIYSEEGDKLLGTCKSDWTLYVDGYGSDGKHIYDSENGMSCHQCSLTTID